jgi:DNA-binding NtrC family response regulator
MNAVAIRECQSSTNFGAGRVLIADDQPHILAALEMLLKDSGFSTEIVTDPGRVLLAMETEQFDAVLMDLNYTRGTVGGREGLQLVSQLRALDSLLPVVVMTAWSSVDLAVEAMRRGASDFIQKPWENLELLQKLQTNCRWRERKGEPSGCVRKNYGMHGRSRTACFPSDCPMLLDMR